MTFAGDIPNYGVSYIDENNARKHLSVGLSGDDGSLILSESSFKE